MRLKFSHDAVILLAATAVSFLYAGCADNAGVTTHLPNPRPDPDTSPLLTAQIIPSPGTELPPPGQAQITLGSITKSNRTESSDSVACTHTDETLAIDIEHGPSMITVLLSNGVLSVRSVGLGIVNGTRLSFEAGLSDDKAMATRRGDTYLITGTATGATTLIPPRLIHTPFTITVTCP